MKKETQNILKQRAINMAVEPEQERDASTIIKVIEFTMGNERYGIESAYVREVYKFGDFTPLPGVPSFILGIVNIHGQIVPVVNLKKFFNIPEKGLGELNKLIIIYNDQMEFGVLSDEVNGTKTIYIEDLLPVPVMVSDIGEKYLKGITKESLIILSAENLLSDKNMVVNEEVTYK